MTISRRQFLHNTAATGTALTALGAAGAARAAAANDKIIVGVMGVNGRGNSLARSFASRQDAEVAYVCDVDERALAKAIKTVASVGAKKPKGVKDFRNILDDASIDALVIAAPDHWHGPATILACTHGKHVYVAGAFDDAVAVFSVAQTPTQN